MPTHDRNSILGADVTGRRSQYLYDKAIYENDARLFIARALVGAHNTIETLQLYAKSVVRMLEACDAEANMLQRLNGIPRKRPSMDLEFVRADIDRLVGEAQGQLALANSRLEIVGRSH